MNGIATIEGMMDRVRRTVLAVDGGHTDGDLLERYVRFRDEAAFEALVRRQGAKVLGVCRRVLGNAADADDAFQATFLVLVRKASTIVPRAQVGNWLYGVAYITARKAKAMFAKRKRKERHAGELAARRPVEAKVDPRESLLDEELSRLPDRYRAPIVLCELEGKTVREAARQLDWPQGTVAGRLSRGRRLLARRLTQRGLNYSAAGLAALLEHEVRAAVPRALIDATTQAASAFAAGAAETVVISAKVAALTKGVLTAMLISKLKFVSALLTTTTLAICATLQLAGDSALLQAQAPAGKKPAPDRDEVWQEHATLPGEKDRVHSVAFSPDGGLLASGYDNGKIQVWDVASRKILAKLSAHTGRIHQVAFSSDGKWLASAGEDKTARMWEVGKWREARRIIHEEPIHIVSFTPDSAALIAGGGVHTAETGEGRGEKLRVWDVASGKEKAALAAAAPSGVHDFTLSRDGKTMVVAVGNLVTVYRWDGKENLTRVWSARANESGFVYGMALTPDAKTLVVSWDAKLHVYDVASGKMVHTLEKSYVGCWGPLTISPDGKTAFATIDLQEKENAWIVQRRSMVRTWDVDTGKVGETFTVDCSVGALAFAPDGTTLAIGGRGDTRFPAGKFIDLSRLEESRNGDVKLYRWGKIAPHGVAPQGK